MPRYAQIERVAVSGDAETLAFDVVLAARVPETIGDDESARVTVGILTDDGHRYSLYAQGSQDGWAAYAVGGDDGPFPGDLTVAGRKVSFTIERDHFAPLASFRWLANVAYGKGNAYGFDVLPEDGYARFP